jgi:hypothetical protein
MLGSTEWVEDHFPWLSQTAISYLNIGNVLGTMCLLSSLTYCRYVRLIKLSWVVFYNKMLPKYCFAKPFFLYLCIH